MESKNAVTNEDSCEAFVAKVNSTKPKQQGKKKKWNANHHPVGCQCIPCKDRRSQQYKQNNSVTQEPKEIKVQNKKSQPKGY